MRPLIVFVLVAAVAAAAGAAEAPLTNADVIAMVNAGLSADLVVAKIKASSTAFALDTAALVALAEAKVPEPVIKAMMAAGPTAAAAPAAAAESAPAQPAAPIARTVLAKRIPRTVGLCSARGDLIASNAGLEFVPSEDSLCKGTLVSDIAFLLPWEKLRSVCFEYAIWGTVVVRTLEGKEYSLKEMRATVEGVEKQLKALKPDLPYRCE